MSKKAVTEKATKPRFPRTKFPKLVSTERKKQQRCLAVARDVIGKS